MELDPKTALGKLQERATNQRMYDEFRATPTNFSLKETTPAAYAYDVGVRTALELRIGAMYVVYGGHDDRAYELQKQNALRSIAHHLYGDVLDDLRRIMVAAGDGKRGETLDLLNGLYERLRQ